MEKPPFLLFLDYGIKLGVEPPAIVNRVHTHHHVHIRTDRDVLHDGDRIFTDEELETLEQIFRVVDKDIPPAFPVFCALAEADELPGTCNFHMTTPFLHFSRLRRGIYRIRDAVSKVNRQPTLKGERRNLRANSKKTKLPPEGLRPVSGSSIMDITNVSQNDSFTTR